MTSHPEPFGSSELLPLAAALGAFLTIIGEALLLALLVPLLAGHGAFFGSDAGRIGSLVAVGIGVVLLVVGPVPAVRAFRSRVAVTRRFGFGALIVIAVVVGAAGVGWLVSSIDLAVETVTGSVALGGWLGAAIGVVVALVHALGSRRVIRVLRRTKGT